MKLLSKNQIQEVKNKERQLDIDQGMSFARKVDVLRETKEKEEIDLAKFRKESMDSLKKDIGEAMSKRDSLLNEVKDLELRKEEALKPLTKEWVKLSEKKSELDETEKRISELTVSLAQKERDVEIKQNQANSLLRQSELKLESSKSKYEEASRDRDEADTTLKVARLKRQEIELELAQKAKEIHQKETLVGAREYTSSVKEDNLIKKEKELNDRDRAINDKYETLLRTIKRYGKR